MPRPYLLRPWMTSVMNFHAIKGMRRYPEVPGGSSQLSKVFSDTPNRSEKAFRVIPNTFMASRKKSPCGTVNMSFSGLKGPLLAILRHPPLVRLSMIGFDWLL